MSNTSTKKPGTIYFVGEEDKFGLTTDDYVKIGLINKSTTGRTSNDRKDEHQTGNPRQLIVIDSIETRASVSTLEKYIHQSLSMSRHRGEWFVKPNGSIKPFVKQACSINKSLEELLDLEEKLKPFSSTADSGKELSKDSEASDIHVELVELTTEIQNIDQNKKLIEYQLRALGGTSFAGIAGICNYVDTKPASRFNSKSFQEEYPDLFEKYAKQEISAAFRIRKTPAKKRIEQLSSLQELFESQKESQSRTNILDLSEEAKGLHHEWLKFHVRRQPLLCQKELLVTKLKKICGENKGIKDICSWSRNPKLKLGKSDLTEVADQIIAKHIVQGLPKTNFIINPFRPYKF